MCTSKKCKWTNDELNIAISNSIDNDYLRYFDDNNTPLENINAVLKTKYNSNFVMQSYNELKNIKQSKFYSIKNYFDKIKIIVEQMSIAENWSVECQNQKLKEIFYQGLHEVVKIEFQKLNINEVEEMYRNILNMENIIIQERFNKKHIQPKQNKYCSNCKRASHNTNECRRKKEYTPHPRSLAIKEKNLPKTSLDIKGQINGEKIIMTLDTGSAYNFISYGALNNVKLYNKKFTLPKSKIFLVANGEETEITEGIITDIIIENDNSTKYSTFFKIIKGKLPEIILGVEFLQDNDANINFKDGTYKIGNKEYEINNFESKIALDKELSKNNKIYKVNCSEETQKINEIIRKQIEENPKLGNIKNVKHQIVFEKEPIIQNRNYKVPLAIREEGRNYINELEQDEIISKSYSPYTSPAFFILKKDNDLRLIVDYRAVNKATVPIQFPMPSINDYLIELNNSKRFSQVDLRSGYYQIQVSGKDKLKTGFNILGMTYVFNRMPFGLSNAPRTFQKAMLDLLGHLRFVKIFLDDILIHSENENEHYNHLKEVFNIIKKNNISINFSKSNFNKDTVKYLGHIITSKGIKPDITRIENFELEIPKKKRDIQKITGLLNWFRPYVPKLSERLSLIYDKLKTTKFNWGEKDTEIIQEIIKIIKKQILLNYPDITKRFYINTGASNLGIGAILYQQNNLIGIYSKKFSETEISYTTVEKETLAIIQSVNYFRNIIFNCEITLRTDNTNLLSDGCISKRINRWKLLLSEYNIKLEYIKGKENNIADGFSRIFKINTYIGLNLFLKENINDVKIWHDKLVHPGVEKQYQTMKKFVNTPKLKDQIRNIIKTCIKCNTEKKMK